MQLNQEKNSLSSARCTSLKRGIFSVTLFFATPFLASAATFPALPDVAPFVSNVTTSIGSFIDDATHMISSGVDASRDITQEVGSVALNGVANTAHAFVRDASRTGDALFATFTLPLDFIVDAATDYAHFTAEVGQTVAQNFTDAAHSSVDLYRSAFASMAAPVIDTTTILKQTLTDEVHTATVMTKEGSMVLVNTARDITNTTRDTLSHLSFSTKDFNGLALVITPFENAGAIASGLAHTVADTTTHAFDTLATLSLNLTTGASDTVDAITSSAGDTLSSVRDTARSIALAVQNSPRSGLALNTKNQTASVFGAVNEFWTDFLYAVFGPTETVTTVSTPEIPTPSQAPTSPQITATPPPAPTTITRVTQPVIERTIERTRVLSGVTATDLESQIAALRSELLNEIAKGKATAVQDNNALYLAMAPMNRINNLSSVTISNPTITGASITGTTISGYLPLTGGSLSGDLIGSTGSFTTLGIGTTTPSATFAVNGVTYLAEVSAPAVTTNRLYNVGGNLYWGATVIGGSSGDWTLTGSDVSYSTGNVGIGTTTPYATLSVVGTSVLGTITGGVWNGTAINDTYLNLGTGAGQLSAADMLITDTGNYFTGITGNTNAVLQHLGQEVGERWSSGVVSGGTIATSTGNTVDIAAGVGYIGSTRITWNASTSVAMTANGDNWISVDSTGAIRIDNTEPSIDNYIRLGYVYTTASNTVIGLAASSPSYAGNYESRNNNFVMKGIGAVVQSGNIVGTTSTPLNIQATSGVINSNLKEFTVPDVSTFTKWYNSADNGWVNDTADNLVNTTKYNVTSNNQASALVTMTASYWKKDLILRTLDGNLHYIYGQAQYSTEQAAKDGPLPSIPTAITNGGSAYLATAVVQNGDTTLADRLYDIRPNLARVFGFGTSGTTGSIATHSALSGLAADDHTQYVLASGARSMAGTLNMGTNAITGLTSLTATGLLKTTLTTEQMRLGYDASNYTSFTVGSTGALTIGTTGTGTTTLTNGVNVGSGNGYYIGGVRAVSGANDSATSFGFSNTVSSAGIAFGNSNTASASGAIAFGKGITNTTASSLQIGPSDAAKLTILSSGNVGIGTTSPYAKLSVVGEVAATNFTATSTTATSTIYGKLAVGRNQASSNVNGTYFTGGLTSWLDNVGVDDVEIGLGRADNTTATAGSMIFGGRSRGTLATPTLVSSGDTLLTIQAVGHDGTDFAKSSAISFEVDAATGANDMPGRIVFSTSADGAQTLIERMRITSAGNVGIGTTSPYAKLSVVGEIVGSYLTATSTSATSTFSGGLDVGSGAFTYDYGAGLTSIQNLELGSLSFDTNAGVLNWIDMPVTASSTAGTVQSYSAQIDGNPLLTVYGESDGGGAIRNGAVGIGTTSPYSILSVSTASTTSTRPLFTVASSTHASLLTVTYDGKVGIGTAAPAKSLQVVGDIRVGTSGTNGCVEDFAGTALTGTCSSDASLKTNIQPLGGVLPGLVQLTPSTFYWNDLAGSELHNSTTTQNYGLIAQDVARVLPNLVATTSSGYLGVNYSMLPILTLQGLKELDLNLEGLASTTTAMIDEKGDKTFAGRFFDRMTGWFADAANGISEFFANRIHTKTLCVGDSIEGETCITKSQLDTLLSGGSIANATPTSVEAPVEATAPSTPITISINGNNPATLNIGDRYGDLGALITAPESAKNFGIKASLDGGPALDISQITLDTSVAGSHTIIYSVVDQNNVTTTAERVVNVVAPVPNPSAPEPTPAIEPEPAPVVTEAPAPEPTPEPEATPAPTPTVDEAPAETVAPIPASE